YVEDISIEVRRVDGREMYFCLWGDVGSTEASWDSSTDMDKVYETGGFWRERAVTHSFIRMTSSHMNDVWKLSNLKKNSVPRTVVTRKLIRAAFIFHFRLLTHWDDKIISYSQRRRPRVSPRMNLICSSAVSEPTM